MKEVIGLVVFLGFAIVIVYGAFDKRIGTPLAVSLFLASLAAGFVIAKSDDILNFRFSGLDITTIQQQVTEFKDQAISEIRNEVEAQKESIKLLTSEANQSRERLSEQQGSIESIVATAQEVEGRIGEHWRNIIKIDQESRELALHLFKTTWLLIETRSEFGGKRLAVATDAIMGEMNRMLIRLIPDERKRDEWIREMYSILPQKKKNPN